VGNQVWLHAFPPFFVIAGLGPATHEFFSFEAANAFVDARAKPAHDGVKLPHAIPLHARE
jgi:hypothetical protein